MKAVVNVHEPVYAVGRCVHVHQGIPFRSVVLCGASTVLLMFGLVHNLSQPSMAKSTHLEARSAWSGSRAHIRYVCPLFRAGYKDMLAQRVRAQA
ncbi:hypothetical protein DIPPA_23656 [Diplonema papillatum]|nr:hypothetical protein DIPPA_23656 [Diplonema papillatum]